MVVLHYFLGMPLPEVATTLGIPLGNAKSRLHRSLGAMRASIALTRSAVALSERARPLYETAGYAVPMAYSQDSRLFAFGETCTEAVAIRRRAARLPFRIPHSALRIGNRGTMARRGLDDEPTG